MARRSITHRTDFFNSCLYPCIDSFLLLATRKFSCLHSHFIAFFKYVSHVAMFQMYAYKRQFIMKIVYLIWLLNLQSTFLQCKNTEFDSKITVCFSNDPLVMSKTPHWTPLGPGSSKARILALRTSELWKGKNALCGLSPLIQSRNSSSLSLCLDNQDLNCGFVTRLLLNVSLFTDEGLGPIHADRTYIQKRYKIY